MDTNQYGKPGDVYGLAVTVINLLHGSHPVEGNNPQTLPIQWQQTLRAYKPYLSTPQYDLLQRMIYSRPQDRITVSDALQHDFFKGAAVSAVPKMLAVPHPGYYWTRLNSTAEDRRVSIEMMIDLGFAYGFHPWTIVHAVHLYDDFWSNCQAFMAQNKIAFELYAYIGIWLAGKYFEQYAMPLSELVQHARQRLTTDDFVDAEERLISTLNFRIVRRPPTKLITNKVNAQFMKHVLGSPEYTVGQFVPKHSLRLIYKTQSNSSVQQKIF
jgi:hypothetical protein